ncbi:hypothetical protein HDU79_000184 [Rhizoclosmatium sp. JEL0117]|nr:hypothetical protein HDU79_000184 [Rhizoclosmatium sp. JEL0117]
MSYVVTGSPFLQSFKNDLSCLGPIFVPTLAHLCLSRPTSGSHMTLSAKELSDAYKSANLITFKGASSVCGSNTAVDDRLNTVLLEAYSLFGSVSSFSYDVTISGTTVTQFSLSFQFSSYPCGFLYYNAATQDPKYILSAPPKCGSQFTKTPSSAITPEASCFGALQFDGKTGTASFPWCNNFGPYTEASLAQRYGTTQDMMALYSLGTDKLVVQFANDWSDWSVFSNSPTLCTLEYHSIGLGETKGTFVLSDKDTVRGDAAKSLDNACISIMTDDSTSGNFLFPGGDVASCGGNSFNDRFTFLFDGYAVAANYIDLDTVIVVISPTRGDITSNVGAQIQQDKRRDGNPLQATDWMLVYKRGIAPTVVASVTSTIVPSTVLSSTFALSTVAVSSLSTILPTSESSSVVLSSTVLGSTLTTDIPSTTVSATDLPSLLSGTVSSAEATQVSSTATVSLQGSQTQTSSLISTLSTATVSLSASQTPTVSSSIPISSTATVSANTACKTKTPSQALMNIANGPIPASSSQNYSSDATDNLAALIKQAPAVLAKTGTFEISSTFLLSGPLGFGASVNMVGASFDGGIDGVAVLISSVQYKFLGDWDIQTYGDVSCTFVVNASVIDNGISFYYMIDSAKIKSEWFAIQLSEDGKQLIVVVNTEHTVLASVSFGVAVNKARDSINYGFAMLNVVGSTVAPISAILSSNVSSTAATASTILTASTVAATSISLSSIKTTISPSTSLDVQVLSSSSASLGVFTSPTAKITTTADAQSTVLLTTSPVALASSASLTTTSTLVPNTSKTTSSPESMIPVAVQTTTSSKTVQINVLVSDAKAIIVSFLAAGFCLALF